MPPSNASDGTTPEDTPPQRRPPHDEETDLKSGEKYSSRINAGRKIANIIKDERSRAIEEMEAWFHKNFEDPKNETPYDIETCDYQYLWGGPYGTYMIHQQFRGRYDWDWIDEAINNVASDEVVLWAPRPDGDFYKLPPDDGSDEEDTVEESQVGESSIQISYRILSKLDALEAILEVIPPASPNIGHNLPPNEIGLPPYDEQSRREFEEAVHATRDEVSSVSPRTQRLRAAQSTLRKIAEAILKWIGRKLDLAVDEAIKATVKAAAWGAAAALALGIADDIAALIRSVMH